MSARFSFLPLALGATVIAVAGALPKPAPGAEEKPSVVRVVKTDAGWELQRDGKPYLIKGGGGEGELKALAAAGGNSVRTWGTDNLDQVLDEAQRLGLTVTVGIWLGHERHGFDYTNADQVAEQYERARQAILKYRNHPAVLMWGIGNEMEGYANGDNAAIWSAVNNIASLAKRLDPNHPTMTVVAEIGGDRVKNIHRLCPDIDIVGINSYAGGPSIPERYVKAGGEKPYVLTEFGPAGTWEVQKNPWGAAPEPTSTEKAAAYRKVYQQAVLGQKGKCLGGYAFTWGHKQEATATWFGMFLPDGSRLAAVDALTEVWSGKPPANRCPDLQSITLEGAPEVMPGGTIKARLAVADPEGDPLKVRWVLQAEPLSLGTGGDAEETPPTFPEAIVSATNAQAEVRVPMSGGGYRLFAYVYDGKGGAAVGNVPLKVNGPVVIPDGKPATLPLVVWDEDAGTAAFTPTGWMGNTKAIKLDPKAAQMPHSGKTCLKAEYTAPDNWGGVVWQSPQGDWGDRPGGWNLTGATRLSFWARGEAGGEVVSFQFGLLEKNKRFFDTGKGKLSNVTLTPEWKEYTLDLKDQDLKRIKTGFCWVVAGGGKPVTFYLDDIRYE